MSTLDELARAFYERRDADVRVVAVAEPYPAPEVSSRDGVAGVMPAVVSGLAGVGDKSGWEVITQYSRGCRPHATTGQPGAVKELWAVRFARAGWGAYAVHDGKTWTDVWMWGENLAPFGLGGVTDLKLWLMAEAQVGAEWYQGIRDRVAGQERAARLRARARPAKRPATEAL